MCFNILLFNKIYLDQDYFCIWYTNSSEGFLLEKRKLLIFKTLNEIISFCKNNNVEFDEEIIVFNIDTIINALSKNDFLSDLEYSTILDFWNIVTDLSSSLNIIFDNADYNIIYNKIFHANNIKGINKKNNKKYIPHWTDIEINSMRSLLNDGVNILKMALK